MFSDVFRGCRNRTKMSLNVTVVNFDLGFIHLVRTQNFPKKLTFLSP